MSSTMNGQNVQFFAVKLISPFCDLLNRLFRSMVPVNKSKYLVGV